VVTQPQENYQKFQPPQQFTQQQASIAHPQQQATTSQQQPTNSNQTHIRMINASSNQRSNLRGYAIFNNSVLEYIVDNGSNRTVISKKAYEQIKNEDPTTENIKQHDLKVFGIDSVVNICGSVTIRKFKYDATKTLDRVQALVAESINGCDCILGLDWQQKIPQLRRLLHNTSKAVDKMSKQIIECNQQAIACKPNQAAYHTKLNIHDPVWQRGEGNESDQIETLKNQQNNKNNNLILSKHLSEISQSKNNANYVKNRQFCKNRAKVRQTNYNNLKIYPRRGHEPEPTNNKNFKIYHQRDYEHKTTQLPQAYIKNSNNRRWVLNRLKQQNEENDESSLYEPTSTISHQIRSNANG
jgi:hypothetical protein